MGSSPDSPMALAKDLNITGTKVSANEVSGVYRFKDPKMVPDPFLKYDFTLISENIQENPKIVIDNGK